MKIRAKWDNPGHWTENEVFEVLTAEDGTVFINCHEGTPHFLIDDELEYLGPEEVQACPEFEICQ